MDQVVQQNAALVEEATGAAESMKEQAGSLLGQVSRFKLGGEHSHMAPLQAAASRSAEPLRVAPAGKVKDRAKLAPQAAALGAPRLSASGNGERKEF
jgi:methyl-accepting chemotaxis protein